MSLRRVSLCSMSLSSVGMLHVTVHSVVMLSLIIYSVFKLIVATQSLYAKCRYAKCHYAKCRLAECRCVLPRPYFFVACSTGEKEIRWSKQISRWSLWDAWRMAKIRRCREDLLKGKDQYNWPPCPNLFRLAPFHIETVFFFFTFENNINEEVNCTVAFPFWEGSLDVALLSLSLIFEFENNIRVEPHLVKQQEQQKNIFFQKTFFLSLSHFLSHFSIKN